MSRLLVSVRDAVEARIAFEAGADLIDLKEPNRGALGAVAPVVVHEVVELLAERVPISAALGELRDISTDAPRLPQGLRFAKVGLAGCASVGDWPNRWSRLLATFLQEVAPVAVVYADWRAAVAPAPADVLKAAIDVRCCILLVDTYLKDGRNLLDHWPLAELSRFVGDAREAGLMVVLGGSLSRETISQVLPLPPDYIAVRGATCSGPRTGNIDAPPVRELVAAVHTRGELTPAEPAASPRGIQSAATCGH